MAKKRTQEGTDRLTYYEDLAAQGRLLILPCAVGDSYFTIEKFCDEHGKLKAPEMHYGFECEGCDKPCNADLRIVERNFYSAIQILDYTKAIREIVFLTRAEAEAALAARTAQRMGVGK